MRHSSRAPRCLQPSLTVLVGSPFLLHAVSCARTRHSCVGIAKREATQQRPKRQASSVNLLGIWIVLGGHDPLQVCSKGDQKSSTIAPSVHGRTKTRHSSCDIGSQRLKT